ncbi:MAG: polysaccharide deacetylase family protein [Candidatus Shapirobacteria bacterium]
MKQYTNIFSVDLEDWYHSSPEGRSIKTNDFRILDPTEKILKLLKQSNNFGTFFVVGEIAQKHPQLIKEIFKQGHEIACHTLHHNFIYNMSQKQFENDVKESKDILENLTHQKIIGYRAPAWSVDQNRTPWFWQTLKNYGFKYSSSIFPFKTFLYGDNHADQFQSTIGGILEIPPSTYQIFRKRIPFSGGFYLRCFPSIFIKYFTHKINQQKQPVIFYIHPREIDLLQPRIKLPPKEYFIHYYNINRTLNKLKTILKDFPTTSFKQYYHFPKI